MYCHPPHALPSGGRFARVTTWIRALSSGPSPRGVSLQWRRSRLPRRYGINNLLVPELTYCFTLQTAYWVDQTIILVWTIRDNNFNSRERPGLFATFKKNACILCGISYSVANMYVELCSACLSHLCCNNHWMMSILMERCDQIPMRKIVYYCAAHSKVDYPKIIEAPIMYGLTANLCGHWPHENGVIFRDRPVLKVYRVRLVLSVTIGEKSTLSPESSQYTHIFFGPGSTMYDFSE